MSRQETRDPPVILALPDNLTKETLVALVSAHLDNILDPDKGYRHHVREVLRRNDLPPLDLGVGRNSWGIFKILAPTTTMAPEMGIYLIIEGISTQIVEEVEEVAIEVE